MAIENYQAQGFAENLTKANRAIAYYRQVTPENFRQFFRRSIRQSSDGYTWSWILR